MELKTREIDNIIIFDLEGEFRGPVDATTLRQHLKSHLEEGKRNFLLNFDKIDLIDDHGMGAVTASFISIYELGGKLKFTKLPPRIKCLFQIGKLDRIFEIFDDEEAAIKSFSN
ncbi:MAG: STAS domain-containing protein [Candidatus Aminicenantes bacterium]|nr:STAS domain-containing protein [Candidatus Aminicenantes bacterium]